MKFNNRVLWVIVALLVLAAFTRRAKSAPLDIGIPDTLAVDSVVAFQGGIGVVPVRFFNDQPLTGIEFTFAKNSAAVTLDSVSFAGSRAVGVPIKGVSHNANGTESVYAIALSESDVIAPGSGIFCKLYYSYPLSITPQVITLDSTTFIDGQLEKGTWFTDTVVASGQYHPKFRRGYLNIQAAPSSFDSVWVDNKSVTAGTSVSVDVNYFNERNVKIAELALNYGNDRLVLDSISFSGTRGDVASNKTYQFNPASHSLYIALDFGEISPLSPGSGSIATLYFTAQAGSPDTVVAIDSTKYAGVLSTVITLTAVDANRQFTPIFRSGSVAIQSATDVDEILDGLPTAYALLQNYPNPFNPTTEIEFALPKSSPVSLLVYNVLGQQVRTLADQTFAAGQHRITFDGRADDGTQLGTGVYFYRLTAEGFTQSRKMLLVK
jgi:hypothetical protein